MVCRDERTHPRLLVERVAHGNRRSLHATLKTAIVPSQCPATYEKFAVMQHSGIKI